MVRSGAYDINSLPRDLIEQDKYNFLGELRRSMNASVSLQRDDPRLHQRKSSSPLGMAQAAPVKGQTHSRYPAPQPVTKRSKSDGMAKDAPFQTGRPATGTSIMQPCYDGIFNTRGSKSLRNTPANNTNTSAQFYGFEIRNIKKVPGGNGPRESAQAIEERLATLGQNPMVSMHSYNRNKH